MALELLLLCYVVAQPLEHLSVEERQKRARKNPRISIKKYGASPFMYLFRSGNDQALLNCCAVDHNVFRDLLRLFEPVFQTHVFDHASGTIRPRMLTANGKPKGRAREIDAVGCLGLVLFWYRTKGSCARATSLAFGLTASTLYRWLWFSRRILLCVLQFEENARVKPPTSVEVQAYCRAIEMQYPVLKDANKVWGACDGLKLEMQQTKDWWVQNRFYNGWTKHTYINSIFVFAPDGKIRVCVTNAPGSWHDSTMADSGVYETIENVYNETGAKIVVDSAFRLHEADYLLKSSQDDPLNGGARAVQPNTAATSVRQLSEHGMRMIQGQFPRLTDKLPFEEFGERKVILTLMILLYNYQTTTIGINHIKNSFMSETKGFNSFAYHGEKLVAIEPTACGAFPMLP